MRLIGTLYFAYTKQVKIHEYDPPNIPIVPNQPNIEVVVYGSSFLGHRNASRPWVQDTTSREAEVEHALRCRMNITSTNSLEVIGRFYNNGSVGCQVPGSVITDRWN